MILDANEFEGARSFHTDICIVGSGAAGITIAREFCGTAYQIIVLEGGGGGLEPQSQEPYQSEVVGLSHGGIHQGRARAFGGTTWLWAGQCLPLFDIDFVRRDWVRYSGWPFSRSELSPYYLRAQEVMQVPAATYDLRNWPNDARPPESDDVRMAYSQFTHTPNFQDKYGTLLRAAPNITVLTHANVIALHANAEASAVQNVEAKSFSGRMVRVDARIIIVCCGGIESARLLLTSDSVEPNGIGNRHDVVGRFFQDHPGVPIPIRVQDKSRFAAWYNSFARDRIRYAIKLVTSDAFQRANQTLHVGAEIYYPASEDDPINAAKLVLKSVRQAHLRKDLPKAIKNVALRPHRVARAMFRHYVMRQPASVGGTAPLLGLGTEQAPNPESRVTLSDQRDSLGVRRAKLDWRLTTLETHSIRAFATAVQAYWQRTGVASLDLDAVRFEGRELGKFGGYVDANHHIGTTRMGTDPLQSVVNADCKVHGYENLYVASSSVFPTGGFSNPTLTLIALCLRLSDHLKQLLAGGRLVSDLTAAAAAKSNG